MGGPCFGKGGQKTVNSRMHRIDNVYMHYAKMTRQCPGEQSAVHGRPVGIQEESPRVFKRARLSSQITVIEGTHACSCVSVVLVS